MNGHARYIVGDVFATLASLPDASVDLVLTSPPFLGLRSYLPDGDPNKGAEIGSEATPAAFVDVLLALAKECRRVLAPHGSLCVELGDTYSGSGSKGGDDTIPGHLGYGRYGGDHGRYGDEFVSIGARARQRPTEWPLPKSLCGIPHLFPLSLAYGRNLLTGTESPAGRWRVRNIVAWCRPNPPVGAVGDKFRPATSYMTVACVSGSRFFDLDAVRTPLKKDETQPIGHRSPRDRARAVVGLSSDNGYTGMNAGGAPPLDYWEIATHPFDGAHFATWPPDLCTRPVLAMCPQRVCEECGQPSRRVVDHQRTFDNVKPSAGRSEASPDRGGPMGANYTVTRDTTGWTDCGHNRWRRGVVLDPFAGSGTTLAVATGNGRDAIGIDIDPRNALLAERRVGMFLTVELPAA